MAYSEIKAQWFVVDDNGLHEGPDRNQETNIYESQSIEIMASLPTTRTAKMIVSGWDHSYQSQRTSAGEDPVLALRWCSIVAPMLLESATTIL